MKLKSYIAIFAGFLTYLAMHFMIMGYENTKAHTSLNSYFVDFLEEFVKKEAPDWIYLTLSDDVSGKLSGPGVTNRGFFENTTSESTLRLSPKGWIDHGGMSADEPEIPASVRHFYDPLGLRDGKKYLTNRGTYWEGVYPNPGIDAIEWALGDTPKGEDNEWSAKRGKEYMLLAIKEANESKREEYLAKAWRCLGEVLHNTADMACPPHVRNDSHAAPFGWTGGWVMGSPDAYEEMFNPDWVKDYSKSKPDPTFWESIQEVQTIREVNEKLAKFTNANFFSNETISGMGVKKIKPANGESEYPSPKLDNLEYDEESFTYYKQFPSGRRVKMCKDHSYFNFRGYPYIDMDCAKSQASELVPNFIWAALKVFVLYSPPLSYYIDDVDVDGKITGYAKTVPNKEYTETVNYNGKVTLFVGNKIYTIDCKDGKFEKTVPLDEINSADNIYASISFGGLTYKTEKFKSPDFSSFKNFELSIEAFVLDNENKDENVGFSFKNEKSFLNWNKNIATYSETKVENDNTKTYDLKFTRSYDGFYYENITLKRIENYSYSLQGFDLSNKYEFEIVLKNVDNKLYISSLDNSMQLFDSDVEKVVQSVYYKRTEKSPVYDNAGKIIEVKTIIKEYKKMEKSTQNYDSFSIILKK